MSFITSMFFSLSFRYVQFLPFVDFLRLYCQLFLSMVVGRNASSAIIGIVRQCLANFLQWRFQIWFVKYLRHCCRGATTFSKLGVQFLALGYCYPSTEKNRQVYPVWCSRLHNHTPVIKMLRKKLGVRPNFGEVRTPPTPHWLRPCV